jgi:hypothetical protein
MLNEAQRSAAKCSEVQDLISAPRQSRNIASKPQPRAASEFLRRSHLKHCSKNTVNES